MRRNLMRIYERSIPEKHIMPFTDIENFISDSSNINLDLTFVNISVDEQRGYINVNCFNDKGIQHKCKKRIVKKG